MDLLAKAGLILMFGALLYVAVTDEGFSWGLIFSMTSIIPMYRMTNNLSLVEKQNDDETRDRTSKV